MDRPLIHESKHICLTNLNPHWKGHTMWRTSDKHPSCWFSKSFLPIITWSDWKLGITSKKDIIRSWISSLQQFICSSWHPIFKLRHNRDSLPPLVRFHLTIPNHCRFWKINITSVVLFTDCTQYTVRCDNALYDDFLGLVRELAINGTMEAHCWCQNNGAGPECPTWLTCPQGFEYFIWLGYNLENLVGNNVCHCACNDGINRSDQGNCTAPPP